MVFPTGKAAELLDIGVELAPHIAQLYPEGVIATHVHGAVPACHLLEQEREAVAGAVDRRVAEFAAGRVCARAALSVLGFTELPLLPGADRAPQWPVGVTGSISHTDGYCVAVAGYTGKFSGLGVDAERCDRLHQSLWQLAFRSDEIASLNALDEAHRLAIATTMFSAKEAFYKCQYSITRSWLDFKDATVHLKSDAFSISLREGLESLSSHIRCANGRFTRVGDLIVAAIAIGDGLSGWSPGSVLCARS